MSTSVAPDRPCPFCVISITHPPTPLLPTPSPPPTRPLSPPTYLLLSTPSVLAFLDIMPLAPAHTLVIPRRHAPKLTDLSPSESAILGAWLPVISRAVCRVVGWGEFNIVQNNGPSAAQVVPHLHYHLIPRPPLGPAPGYTSLQISTVVFGRGQREDLEDKEGAEIAARIRKEIFAELEELRRNRGSGSNGTGPEGTGEGERSKRLEEEERVLLAQL
ncbi:HIT-like domain-containing protein [Kalaharituber pfeilii]|nr:HIT-like domain-containing protein [Kalaharituber pfeilii]